MTIRTPLYVERLTLTDIRCFSHLEIQFDTLGQSIVLIGDNGDGKSTVLRSLAMGICDQSSASALFRELHGEYVRAGSRTGYGTIEVELRGRGRDRFRIVTTIKSLKTFERVDQTLLRVQGNRTKELTQDEFPWDRIFASGYGPGIRVQGMSEFASYLTVDAVYPLFRYDVLLQNPELAVRRLIDAARRKAGGSHATSVLTAIKKLLARVLQLKDPDDIYLEPDGIYVRDSSGKIILSALADGFRGTVILLLDLIAWWFVYRRAWGNKTQFLDVRGIVFIDEIEQHLHPLWQRNIMRLFAESFPHVQLVATTHSPLVASGCEGIPVHRLAFGEHSIERPYGWLAEDVYRMMGLEQGSRPDVFRREVLSRVRELDLRRIRGSATKAELGKLRALERRLGELPGADPVRAMIGMKNIRRLLGTSPSDKRDKTDA